MTLAFEWPAMCFSSSTTCYFYKPTLVNENAEIEDGLNSLTTAYKRSVLVCVLISRAILKGLNGTISTHIAPIGSLSLM